MEVSISSLQGSPPALVANLERLPPEIVHQILDNLPLFKVLDLLSHKTQYAEECVLTHGQLGNLFQSASDVASVIDYFILFRDMRQFTRQSLKYPLNTLPTQAPFYVGGHYVSILSWNYSILNPTSQFPVFLLRDFLIAGIREHLRLDTLDLDLDLLRPYVSTDYPGYTVMLNTSCENFLLCWLWIKEAKQKLNSAKAAQWDKLADLMTVYPGKVMLKKPLDPSQDGPRRNIAHIINIFRGNAKRILRDRKIINPQQNCRCTPGVDLIELVPYDRYLWLFLETLELHPPMDDLEGVEAGLRGVSLSEAMGTSSMLDDTMGQAQGKRFQYPADVTSNIKVVMDGLFYVYTGSPLLIVPRTQWPAVTKPYFVNSGKKPRFFIDPKPHPNNLPKDLHRCLVKKRRPHDEREYDWLEAFLKVVTWMEKEFGGV